MKKQRKQKTVKKKAQPQVELNDVPSADRRKALRVIRNATIGAGLLVGGGVYGYSSVRKTMAEFDLSRLGQGTPSIVQIHDPSCPICRNLQKETRRALREFDNDEFAYLVANITTPEGRAFAQHYGVGHATLVLFDEAGTPLHIAQGAQSRDVLADLFRAQLDL